MSNIESLISLLSSGDVSKDDLVNTINKIQFTGTQAEFVKEQEMPVLNNESANQLEVTCIF
jgi:hypothetical protein